MLLRRRFICIIFKLEELIIGDRYLYFFKLPSVDLFKATLKFMHAVFAPVAARPRENMTDRPGRLPCTNFTSSYHT